MTDQGNTEASRPFDRLPGSRQVRALHGAIEHSLTIQRDQLSGTVDEFVRAGKISRQSADELIEQLVSRSQGYTQGILTVLDSAVAEARRGVSGVVGTAAGAAKRVTGR